MPSSTKKKKETVSSAKKKSNRRRRKSEDLMTPEKATMETHQAESNSPNRRKSSRLDSTSVLETLDQMNQDDTLKSDAKPKAQSPKKQKSTEATENTEQDETIRKRTRSKSPASKEMNDETTVTKTQPTMDVRVHRLRHLEYIPSPILAIASGDNNDGYLAISREDGSYELSVVSSVEEYTNQYNPHIYPVTKLAGSTLAVAHSLCWVPNNASDSGKPTCVAASPDGTLWVVNFAQSQLQCRMSSGGGGIFDLVTCHSSQLPVVAAACQDGFVRLWQVLPNGTIRDPPIATLTTAGSAVLSLAWRLMRQQNGTYETVLFAGVADGTIRKFKVDLAWDNDIVAVKKHAPILRMTMESKGRRQSTKVWTMKIIQDGTLISGNSLGQVQFWNSETGTLIQSIFQSNLKSDVLQLAVNTDETKVFCTGVDSRVVCCERPTYKNPATDATPWTLTNAQRPHTHDVKAMTLVTSDDGRIETLATGGVDTKLCSYVVSDFSKRRPQVWYPWPSNSPISTSPEHRVVSMQRQDHVEVFRLDKSDSATRKSSSDVVGTIQIKTKTNLVTSSLSANGKWMVISDASSLFVFSLDLEAEMFQPEQIELPEKLRRIAATAIHFDQDVLFLAESSTNTVYVVDMTSLDYSVLSIKPATDSSDRLPILSIHTSGDYLVTLSHTKESGVNVFRRSSSSTISYQPYWTVPSMAKARPAALALIQGNQMAVATFTSQVYLFDLTAKRLNPWSEQHGFPIEKWPSELASRRDFPVRLISNPSDPNQLILVRTAICGVENKKQENYY
jgi:U3 small nucleolar RNA-associated protein 4